MHLRGSSLQHATMSYLTLDLYTLYRCSPTKLDLAKKKKKGNSLH